MLYDVDEAVFAEPGALVPGDEGDNNRASRGDRVIEPSLLSHLFLDTSTRFAYFWLKLHDDVMPSREREEAVGPKGTSHRGWYRRTSPSSIALHLGSNEPSRSASRKKD